MPARHRPGTSLILSGTITPAALAMLAASLRDLLAAGDARTVTCEVSRLSVDLGAIDALGRLQLVARRLGGRIALLGASPELEDLLGICGLAVALPGLEGVGWREAGGESEQRKQPTDVEERVERGDLPA